MRGSIRPAALGTLAIAVILAFVVSRSLVRQDRPQATDDQSQSFDVKLSEGDRETFAQILSSHHGQVVLVDFWATWCGPCVKQFPHTVELSHKYRDQGLAVVTVSMNEPKEREKVLVFLTRQKADVENLLPRYGAGSEFLEAFDLRGDRAPHHQACFAVVVGWTDHQCRTVSRRFMSGLRIESQPHGVAGIRHIGAW